MKCHKHLEITLYQNKKRTEGFCPECGVWYYLDKFICTVDKKDVCQVEVIDGCEVCEYSEFKKVVV